MAEDSHYQALAMLRLIYNRLVLPGSTNTAVLILPAANDSICADEVPAAPVVEDFDLEAGLRKAYDSLNSPSASPVVLPASNPISRALVQFRDPHSAWVHSSAVSSELALKQSREAKLVKIPDYPPGVVCCLPPLQYAQNEQGQVVGVIEETLRLLQRFATPSEPEVELHFYFHRVAMENIMRATHAAGVPIAYQCMWHYDDRDKTDFQTEARGFRRRILCREVSFSNDTFNTYNDLAQHWNIHATHKLLRRFCPMPRCMEVVSNE
ncbi:hypothetical protein DFH05DRAFT_1570417 [Lentinula detonsa]|uniref:Uncharacterized protein n=1 Tax=Lentinula detonsa TaxID=2804962 RepID=A0A9W8PCT3_9AGAR|nr:hypothetical protein DFH05DRAFT_1570417 [Lentinula detonsa]